MGQLWMDSEYEDTLRKQESFLSTVESNECRILAPSSGTAVRDISNSIFIVLIQFFIHI